MKIISLLLFVFLIFGVVVDGLAHPYGHKYFPEKDPLVRKRIDQWQDLKFGLLMHWGPYSQWGVVESWSICAEDEPWCRRKIENYEEYKRRYEALKKTFNPVKFNPEKWALAAKQAGMRYVIFTTKHHDGFCMFDTRYTDYKITSEECPFHTNPRANVTKEIFDAFRKEGFWVGAYFSKPDWHSNYYWWRNFATPDRNVNYDIKKYPERWQKFVEFTHNQILEILSDYGKVDILWLDGGWAQPLTDKQIRAAVNSPNYKFTHIQSQDIHMDELVKKARAKQPGLIVVDRAVEGPYENYLTPENQVPQKMLPYPWESCIISGGGWSHVPRAKYKSARTLIHLLVKIVAKGGNLLLNIAPGPDGTWDADAYDLLQKIGDWMKINSESIYGTRPIVPYIDGKVCLTRKKDGTVYAIYLADEHESEPPSEIWMSRFQPKRGSKISFLGTGQTLKWKPVGTGFVSEIPRTIRENPPGRYAWVLKIVQ